MSKLIHNLLFHDYSPSVVDHETKFSTVWKLPRVILIPTIISIHSHTNSKSRLEVRHPD